MLSEGWRQAAGGSRRLGVGRFVVVVGMLAACLGGAAAAQAVSPSTCSGTLAHPGVLAGVYASNVTVTGVCLVNAGPTVVGGNLTVTPGASLVAAYAVNDRTGTGVSSLTVRRSVITETGGTLVMGCSPVSFACLDDPNPMAPTLTRADQVGADVVSQQALGILLHNDVVGGSVVQTLGGGGATGLQCGMAGIFGSILAFTPIYSDYEDNAVRGGMLVEGVRSCYLGIFRNRTGGSMLVENNKMADPDAMEIVGNLRIGGSMVCTGNVPAVHFGDSGAAPNVVDGAAVGQCGFDVFAPDPFFGSGGLQPISVRG